MNKDRAIEILEKIKSKSEKYIKNSQTRINVTGLTQLKNSFKRKQEYAKEKVQALDHAINCVGAIEQIKWERDIAIQQLNELGYQFGEKIRSDEE